MTEQKDFLAQFPCESVTLWRSQIHPAAYNPRTIGRRERERLGESIGRFGVLGGIIVNKGTGYTIVSGHQKVDLLDEKYGYPGNDYRLKADVIDVDLQTEKTINTALNNPNLSGKYDLDMLADVLGDINFEEAGFTEDDLEGIGVIDLLEAESGNAIADDVAVVTPPEPAPRMSEAERQRMADNVARMEKSREQAVQRDKEVRQHINEAVHEQQAKEMSNYIAVQFDTTEAKQAFCQMYGFAPDERIVRGEDLQRALSQQQPSK